MSILIAIPNNKFTLREFTHHTENPSRGFNIEMGRPSTPQGLDADNILNRLWKAIGASDDQEAALIMGLPRSTIGNWRARKTIPFGQLVDACRGKGVSLDWLVFGHGSAEPPRVGEGLQNAYAAGSTFDQRLARLRTATEALEVGLGAQRTELSEDALMRLHELAYLYELDARGVRMVAEICGLTCGQSDYTKQ